jgi:hypothetical protein
MLASYPFILALTALVSIWTNLIYRRKKESAYAKT